MKQKANKEKSIYPENYIFTINIFTMNSAQHEATNYTVNRNDKWNDKSCR